MALNPNVPLPLGAEVELDADALDIRLVGVAVETGAH